MAPTQGPHEHGRFDYSAIVDRKPLRWPNGARVAVWVIPNIEYFWFDRPGVRMSGGGAQLNPDVLNFSWRDYGVRVGIWRMMEIMERYGVRGTVALNSEVCAHYPRIIEAGNALNWEWMGHGTTNSITFNERAQTEDEEPQAEPHPHHGRDHRRRHRQAAHRLAQPRPFRDGAHARSLGRARHPLCRRLGQ